MRTCRVCHTDKSDYCYTGSKTTTCVSCMGKMAGREVDREKWAKKMTDSSRYKDTLKPILEDAERAKRLGHKYVYLTIKEFLQLTEGLRELKIDLGEEE